MVGTIPSYLYQEYSDDDDLQAFVSAYNTIAQQYIDTFNQINLPIYTGPLIVGSLLDWVAAGLYGFDRPSLSSGLNRNLGPFNTWALNTIPFNAYKLIGNANITVTTDDIFKRIITWNFFKGDGNVINIRWLKRRIMRFLYGINGANVNVDQAYQISITFGMVNRVELQPIIGKRTLTGGSILNSFAFNSMQFNAIQTNVNIEQTTIEFSETDQVDIQLISGNSVLIGGAILNRFALNSMPFNTIQSSFTPLTPLPNAAIFKEAMDAGVLQLPFQYKYIVSI